MRVKRPSHPSSSSGACARREGKDSSGLGVAQENMAKNSDFKNTCEQCKSRAGFCREWCVGGDYPKLEP